MAEKPVAAKPVAEKPMAEKPMAENQVSERVGHCHFLSTQHCNTVCKI